MLNHATNYVARHHFKKRTDALTPSSYLDLCITEDQAKLLAPTVKDVVQGSIIENAMGEGAKKKIARRRINMFEGNIASYSRLINSKEQLDSMQELNALTSVLGSMRAENEHERAARAAVRTAEAQQKEMRKQTAADEFEA